MTARENGSLATAAASAASRLRESLIFLTQFLECWLFTQYLGFESPKFFCNIFFFFYFQKSLCVQTMMHSVHVDEKWILLFFFYFHFHFKISDIVIIYIHVLYYTLKNSCIVVVFTLHSQNIHFISLLCSLLIIHHMIVGPTHFYRVWFVIYSYNNRKLYYQINGQL